MLPLTRFCAPDCVIARLQRLDVVRFLVYAHNYKLPGSTAPMVSKIKSGGPVIHGRTHGKTTRPNQNLRPDLLMKQFPKSSWRNNLKL